MIIAKVIRCKRLSLNLHKISFQNNESVYLNEDDVQLFLDAYHSGLPIEIPLQKIDDLPCKHCINFTETYLPCDGCIEYLSFQPLPEESFDNICNRCKMEGCPLKVNRVLYKCQFFTEKPLIWINHLSQIDPEKVKGNHPDVIIIDEIMNATRSNDALTEPPILIGSQVDEQAIHNYINSMSDVEILHDYFLDHPKKKQKGKRVKRGR